MNLMSNIPNLNTSAIFDQEKLNSIDPLENQLCRVCGEPAAGFHFGAFTCEGCKSFFGRSCNNQTVIQECKNNYRCVVDKKNRTACKACRLRKCLMVGMSKSGCRYGRRSNWFKIHCIMQKNADGGGRKLSNNGSISSGIPTSMPYPAQNPSRLQHPGIITTSQSSHPVSFSLADSLLSLSSLQQQHSVNSSAAAAAAAALRGFQLPLTGGHKLHSLSRSPSPLNTSTETLSIQSSPSPASGGSLAPEAPVSPPSGGGMPPLFSSPFPGFPNPSSLHPLLMSHLSPPSMSTNNFDISGSSPPPSLLDQASLYKLSPLLAVHPLLLAATAQSNPLFKQFDFSQQIELLKQRRAMFEAMKSSDDSIIDTDTDINANEETKSEDSYADDENTKIDVENPPKPTEAPIDLSCK